MYEYKYPHPALAADCVVFGFDGRQLHVLLIERGLEPFKGSWALPGGFMHIDETIDDCARRELFEETGVSEVYLRQFGVFSAVNRDPRERVVSVGFLALVKKSDYRLIAGDDASKANWFLLDELPPLAFDHEEIIRQARVGLQEAMKLRPLAFRLLDDVFTMSELQRLMEAVNDTTYDRRNFARKMTDSGYLTAAERPTSPDSVYDMNVANCEEENKCYPQIHHEKSLSLHASMSCIEEDDGMSEEWADTTEMESDSLAMILRELQERKEEEEKRRIEPSMMMREEMAEAEKKASRKPRRFFKFNSDKFNKDLGDDEFRADKRNPFNL